MIRKRKIIITILVAILAICLFGVGIYALDNWINQSDDSEYEFDDERLLYLGDDIYELNKNVKCYLVIGTDNSGNIEAENTQEYKGSMADFLLLLVLNKTDETYGFLQIDRNTITAVPYIDREGNGSEEVENFKEQICCAHWYGANREQGDDNTVYAVSQLLGELPIDGYFSLHMSDIGLLNHAVDGVKVTLDEDFTKSDPAMKKGETLKLSDKQAEIYVRGRKDVGDGTNAARMERQEAYMKAFKAKAIKRSKEDPDFANTLYGQLTNSTALTNIPGSELSVIMNQIYKADDLGILRLEGKTKEGDILDDGLKHEEFYPTQESINKAVMELCGIEETDRTE